MAARESERPPPPWPFTDATVVINCTKEDYDGFEHLDAFGEWSKDQTLELTAGDVITDVKLPPTDFRSPNLSNGWYHGQLREKQGVFSSQYVQFRYSRVPLTLHNVTTAINNVDWEPLCNCLCVPQSKKDHIEQHASENQKRMLAEWWLLTDPSPSWRRLIGRLDFYGDLLDGASCAAAVDFMRHNAEPVQDTTFTLRNVWSTLDTVQYWGSLGYPLEIPQSKHGRKEMMNYYITNTPASWELLAGALYYLGEQTALTKVTSYFQRQPEATLGASSLYDALKEVESVIDERKFGVFRVSKRDLADYLDVPEPKQEEITNHHSDESQHKHAIIEEFINNHPAPSWRLVAEGLYKNKLNRALQIVKQKYLKVESRHLFNEAMKNGHIRSFNTVALLVGSAGSGKTCSKHVILNEQPPEVRVSTAIAERPVKVVKVLTINGLEWRRLTPMQQKEILARIMASRGKEKVDLAVSQLPIRVDNPEPTKKTESKSAHPPPESGSSFPETETTKISTPKSLTTTTAAGQKSSEESSEVLINSPTTEEDFVALIDNSSGSEPIMEVNLIHLVDSGGQPQFHEVLPAFLRRRSAYLFVTDLSENLDAQPQIEYFDENGTAICKACPATHTNLQIFMHCIRTFQSHTFGGKPPNIFTLGTHRDLEHKCSETREAKNRKIAEMLLPRFKDEVVYFNVRKKELIFPLNAKSPEEEDWKTAREIRKLIMEKCSPPPDDTPLRWYGLEIALQEMAEALKRGVMSKQECFAVALRLHFDSDSFEAALQHLDELNIIFYYPKILPDVIFTDPQVLLDKVTELVKFTYELKREDADPVIMAGGSEYQKFQDHALVTSEFLALDKFSKHYVPNLFTPLELVKLFRALLIFADFSDTEYFMPCLLRIISSEEVAKHRLSPSAATVPLVLHFPHGGPLLGMFCCLVVFLLSAENHFPCPWKLLTSDSLGTPTCLYRNCIKFTIPDYAGTVTLIDAFSLFEVHVSSPDNLCSIVHDAVFTGLRNAAANLGYNNSVARVGFLCFCSSENLHLATLSMGKNRLICSRNPEKYGNIDEMHQMWISTSETFQQKPASSTSAQQDPPKITEHPKDQSVATGADITFQVETTGDDLNFQWQKNHSDLHDCNRYCDTHTDTLHIVEVEKSDKGRYSCLVKNAVGEKLSDEAFLAVTDPPRITQYPKDQSVATGADVTFQVEATGDDLTFQWQKNQIDIDDGNRCCGTRTSRLRIIEVEMSDKGRYRCLVKNSVGDEFSQEAFLKLPTPMPGTFQSTGALKGQQLGLHSQPLLHSSTTVDIFYNLPADKPDIIPMGTKQPKRRQHSAMNALTDSCTPKKPRLETVDVFGSQQGAQFLQNVYQQQPPYEQDPHMQPGVQIGGSGQQQPQPKFAVLPTGVLTAKDLHILTCIMKPAAPQWQAIGDALGFSYSDLTIIQNTPMLISQAPQSYFREMLSQWLNWAPPNHPWPTLEALEAALQSSGSESLAFQLKSLFVQGYVPQFYQQYPQNSSQFPPGPTHQPAYPHPGYPPPRYQYPPQQSYYYGQPAPPQLPPAGGLYHASIPPQQHTPDPQMEGHSYQADNEHPKSQ